MAGKMGGRKLVSPADANVRPMMEVVRGAVFNILQVGACIHDLVMVIESFLSNVDIIFQHSLLGSFVLVCSTVVKCFINFLSKLEVCLFCSGFGRMLSKLTPWSMVGSLQWHRICWN